MKHNIVVIPFNTKNIPTINILNSNIWYSNDIVLYICNYDYYRRNYDNSIKFPHRRNDQTSTSIK